jgi:osmoprotectant transport system permease protein
VTGTLAAAYRYAASHPQRFAESLQAHLVLVGIALGVAVVVCVPLGVWTSRSRIASVAVINAVLGLRVIPSLAVLFLAIPYFGLGFKPAVLALILLALPPVLVNTDAAFRGIDPAVKEAARGMGMTPGEVLRRVELPLALPSLFAGFRTAATESIASATLAAFVGAKSLGSFVVLGFSMNDPSILLVGAVPVAALALAVEIGIGALQRSVEPPTGGSAP